MNKKIRKVAVIGSGVMGSRIACHFANIGLDVLLLDIVPRELNDKEKAVGLDLESMVVRNRIVNDALKAAIRSNPSPLYDKKFANRIKTGNLEDDLSLISDCDWIIEAVIERLDIKQQVFENIEKHRTPGTLITTNTSGIPINLMNEGRSDDFKKHFCGTHFFNPPRYLRLLEIIPGPDTDQDVLDFLMHYGDLFLGKRTVMCKDTPAFIANRIGVFSIMALFHLVKEMGLSVEEVDKLTGPVLGRPKSATFRTCDVVGLDTLVHVANGLSQNLPDDEQKDLFNLPDYIAKMVENNWLGAKSGQGFYKKVKDDKGKSVIHALDLNSLEYSPSRKAKFATLESTKSIDDLAERLKVLIKGKDKAGEFYRKTFYRLFQYVSNRIPEIADEIYKVDDAMRAGFGWEIAVFDAWDAVGVKETVEAMKADGFTPASWVDDMLASGNNSFYKIENGIRQYYDQTDKTYKIIPGTEDYVMLSNYKPGKVLWSNDGSSIIDLGDGILNLEFHTKMNAIGSEIIQGVDQIIKMAEKDYEGIVIANEAQNFSAGANLALIFMLAIEQDYDEIDYAIRAFQNCTSSLRFCQVPVVVAPHGLTLGGGCEMTLHADAVQADAECYIGLVEFGVGLIPGGGGTKEFALRLSDQFSEGDIQLNELKERFLTIGMAKVATSGEEAYDLGILRRGIDSITVNRDRRIKEAKEKAIELAEAGYTPPLMRKDILVLGKTGLGMVYAGANTMLTGNYMSEHDELISQKLGYVMCGGDLSQPTKVSEQYLLDLEREAFLSLLGERKTLERIQSILTTGKPLRN